MGTVNLACSRFEFQVKHSNLFTTLIECSSSGEDVSVNAVVIQRNKGAILADLRSEATEEASIAP